MGGFHAAMFAPRPEQGQASHHRHESCGTQDKEIRSFIAQGMGMRRPRFVRLHCTEPGEHSGELKIDLHTGMVWPEREKSSLGIEVKARGKTAMAHGGCFAALTAPSGPRFIAV